MQPSYYLKTYPVADRPDQRLLFSTKQASLVLLPRETVQALEAGTLAAADAERLAKLGMVVADREEEVRTMLARLDELNPRRRGINVIAVMNLDCNFACPYCFEEGVKGDLYMSAPTAERLLAFIGDRWQEQHDTLVIDFYGGEPLLALERIRSIARDARSFAAQRDAAFLFTLVTNGSLFTPRTARLLVPLGLQSVKITLDGPAALHNASRPFTSGRGSFDAIIRNIHATCDLTKINIGGNFTRENYRRFGELLDYLLDAGLTPERIASVKFDAVIDRPANGSLPAEYARGCVSIDEPWLLEAEAFLREEILRRGYRTSKPVPMVCMIETTDAYVVNYDGVIYKCPGFIGKKEFAAGDLAGGVGDYAANHRLGIYKNPACAACVYLPLCFGGCRYMAYIRDGNIDALDCKKQYFDAALETLLKQDIRYRLQK